MSRFRAPDLAALGKPPAVVPVDFEAIKTDRDNVLIAALAQYGISFDVNKLLTDPMIIAYSEGGGYYESLWRERVNQAIESLSLASATGASLEHIGGTYTQTDRLYLVADENNPPSTFEATFDAARQEWVETDDNYRSRIALSFEAFSTAGPEGAYIFHVLELDGVRDIADVACYSEEDGATYRDTLHADAETEGHRLTAFDGRDDGDPVLAPEILIIVLPTSAYGAADQALLSRAFVAAAGRDLLGLAGEKFTGVRPIGDNVRIEAADVQQYAIEVTLTYAPGADPAPLRAAAEQRLQAYANARRRIGSDIQREVIGGRAALDDTVHVQVVSPASNIVPGPYGAAECTGITVNLVQDIGTWS